jgi:hypothetical protein
VRRDHITEIYNAVRRSAGWQLEVTFTLVDLLDDERKAQFLEDLEADFATHVSALRAEFAGGVRHRLCGGRSSEL